MEGGGHVTPKLEVGARHDGSDAETGFGIDLGLATGARDHSFGWRLTPEGRSAANVSFGLRTTRREGVAQPPEQTVGVEIAAQR